MANGGDDAVNRSTVGTISAWLTGTCGNRLLFSLSWEAFDDMATVSDDAHLHPCKDNLVLLRRFFTAL
jgi:hypothetical protein